MAQLLLRSMNTLSQCSHPFIGSLSILRVDFNRLVPLYQSELLHIDTPVGALRSSNQVILSKPKTIFREGSFCRYEIICLSQSSDGTYLFSLAFGSTVTSFWTIVHWTIYWILMLFFMGLFLMCSNWSTLSSSAM